MTPTKKPSERLMTVAKWVVQLRALDPHGLFLVKQFIQHIENPTAVRDEDALDRWASGRKDLDAFCPTLVLWANWLEWCRQAGEPAGTLPVFYARLKEKPWLRKGRTRVAGVSRNGWYGLNL